jgi:hypothetical protein
VIESACRRSRPIKEIRFVHTNTLTPPDLVRKMDAYWRAANYLSVGQIYLYDSPLLKEPLKLSHVKPLVVGHWGTTPGQNFIYVHLNRVIKQYDLDMFYIVGPGHGGAALVANTYLEGTYSVRHQGAERAGPVSPRTGCGRSAAAPGHPGGLSEADGSGQAHRAQTVHRPTRSGPAGSPQLEVGRLENDGPRRTPDTKRGLGPTGGMPS